VWKATFPDREAKMSRKLGLLRTGRGGDESRRSPIVENTGKLYQEEQNNQARGKGGDDISM